MDEQDLTMFKVLIVGSTGVGKTVFLVRYTNPEEFQEKFVSTVGIDFRVQTVERDDKNIKLQIWDTAGQERYRSITTAYYRGSHGFIVMYDVTNRTSFEDVENWVTTIKEMVTTTSIILVANKTDLDREVSTEEGEELANMLGLQYCETSVKDNVDIVKAFDMLLDSMLEGIEAENGDEDKSPDEVGEEKPSVEEKEEENGEENEEERLEESTGAEEEMEKPDKEKENTEKPKEPIKLEKECQHHHHGRGCFC